MDRNADDPRALTAAMWTGEYIMGTRNKVQDIEQTMIFQRPNHWELKSSKKKKKENILDESKKTKLAIAGKRSCISIET